MATTQTSFGTGRVPRMRKSRSRPELSRIAVGAQAMRISPAAPGMIARKAAVRILLPGPERSGTAQFELNLSESMMVRAGTTLSSRELR